MPGLRCSNYAAHVAFIDYRFGTAVRGKNEWPETYRVVGDYVPEGWIKQQAFPLKGKS
jgi:sterol desaturase/sphingolipid hydroxylase (fatty acid hydroxylase superfamily)